ncbi:hypothetical protein BuS5_01234 [Desulfosarcina sp. BuS5]|uniref:glycosyltransferase family 4 protein n=1 Tax=Desulfosarcina sp. BuS5 TaxID=933262 RepID=UPI000482A022|nr:glycosyltransferase family 4 protein [Desulfosarcina sp. BuS5]WDN88266.1 hypothetical protein BuS5_01234 [Desulfosarcina sp. BuS5]
MSELACKAMVCVPSLLAQGGVSNYYRVVNPYFEDVDGVDFFELGGQQRSPLGVALAMILEPIHFLLALINGGYGIVHLNPSIQPRALVRNAVVLVFAKLCRKKAVILWHGWDVEVERRMVRRLRRLFALIFNLADVSLVLAVEFKQRLKDLGVNHDIFVTSTIVEADMVCVREIGRQDCLALMFMARLVENKGIRETVEAFSLLKSEFPDLRLEVAGDGPEKAVLAARYAGLDGLTFHGHIGDVQKYRLMAQCDVFVFPTNYGEGMPTCVLEAMVAGLPVVTRAVGGIRDFFRHGEHGLLVETSEPQELAKSLADLLKDEELRRKISEHNRQYAEDHFSANMVSEFLKKLYAAVCNGDISDLPSEWFASIER